MSYAPAALIAPGAYITGLNGGRKTVSVAGTREQILTSATPCTGIIIQGLHSNTGNVSVGGSDVSAVLAGENGIELMPAQTITLYVTDVSIVYVDAEVSGEGISFLIIR